MTAELGAFALPLAYGKGWTPNLTEAFEVTAVHVNEETLTVLCFTLESVDPGMPRMPRMVHVVPQGSRVDGARHLHTFVRLGQAYHLFLELD